jgi:hypothetical protein
LTTDGTYTRFSDAFRQWIDTSAGPVPGRLLPGAVRFIDPDPTGAAHLATERVPRQVAEIATWFKQPTGVIAFGRLYLYVTSTVIARLAFQSRWARWAL